MFFSIPINKLLLECKDNRGFIYLANTGLEGDFIVDKCKLGDNINLENEFGIIHIIKVFDVDVAMAKIHEQIWDTLEYKNVYSLSGSDVGRICLLQDYDI